MSDYLAVGGVSAVLRWILANALTGGGPSSIIGVSSPVTALSPDLVPTGADEQPQINLFMYYTSLNANFRNNALPSQDPQGRRVSNPPLALDLHYLVSAYGKNEFDPEILLAWAMQVFHNTPVVPRSQIEQALEDLVSVLPAPIENQLISGSTLASQVEHIRITPETLTTEEIYRLWTAFQTHYRPTTSYQVSVVVIQDTQNYASNLPVQRRSLVALPLVSPMIQAVTPAMAPLGQVLTITGNNFLGDTPPSTQVSFDKAPAIPALTVQGSCVRVAVPNTLFAGTHSVRILRTVTFPSSSRPHAGFASNPFPFQVVPVIQLPAVPPIQAKIGNPLTLTLSPVVGVVQEAVVYIGDQAIPVPPRPLSGPATSATITIAVPSTTVAGTYPLRVEVDGAQSALTLDTNSGSPTFGQYLPQVQVTP